ncbi:hypothetical protein ZWY2020_049701 [Hordeum vulgare]|nr:hypothetical protein ZWY2020_049701 [Hordeum vulgare]
MFISAAAAATDLGLRTLIAAHEDANRNVATRTIAASRLAVRCLGGGERDPEVFEEGDEGWDEGKAGEGRGCWVTYGWRRGRLHRLPPLIPSLRRAGSSPWALTRTRTADGRVVVLREPAPRRGRVVARRMDGRLILDLVDSSPVPPPLTPRRAHPCIAQGTDDALDAEEVAGYEEETAAGADIVNPRGLDVPATVRAKIAAASSSPVGSASPVPSMGCFEAVIRTSPLRKVPVSMPRMVH